MTQRLPAFWSHNFLRGWRLFSPELLSRWRQKVMVPLTYLEVCLFLEFFCRFWWIFSHMSPGHLAGPREQLCQAYQLTSAGSEKAEDVCKAGGLAGLYCFRLAPLLGTCRQPSPLGWGCHTVGLRGRLIEHIIQVNPAELASLILFLDTKLWFLLLFHTGFFMSFPEINSRPSHQRQLFS